MKKRNLWLLLVLIPLVGCQQTTSSSSSFISSTPSSPSSSGDSTTSPITPPIDPITMPKNLNGLIEFLNQDGKEIFIEEEQSTIFNQKTESNLVWEDGKETIETTSSFHRYQGNYFLSNESYQKRFYSNVTQTENIEETHEGYHYFGSYQENAIEAFIWDELHQEINNQNSMIEMYQLVNEDTQLDKNLINKNDLFALTSSYRFSFYSFVKNLEKAQDYSFHFELKDRNVLEDYAYHITYSTLDSEYPYNNYFDIELQFLFDEKGYLKEASFISEEFSYDYGIETFTSLNKKEMTMESIKGPLKEPETLPIHFEDYILQDIEIVLTDSQGNPLDVNNIEAGALIYVQTKNPVPEKALDIDFEIVESSNEEVIAQDYLNWTALKAGKSTLTLMNQSGFTKTLEVQVVAPPLSMILITLENEDQLYAGHDYELSIMRIPNASTDLFEVTVKDPSLVQIHKVDDLTYTIQCLAIGHTTIIVTSLSNPTIKEELEIEIKEEPQPLPPEELTTALCSAPWESYSYTIQFNADYSGSITDNYYYDNASFTWSIQGTEITISSFYLSYYDYTINTATISEDGLTLSVHFTNEYNSYPIIQTFMR